MKVFMYWLLFLTAINLLSISVFAETHSSGFNISPMIGRYMPASDRRIEDANFMSIGLGYDFNQRWGVEGTYLAANSELSDGSADVDLQVLRMDALYYFSHKYFRPYFVFGLGNNEFDGLAGDDSEAFANAGVGIKYAINNYIDLRADTRMDYGFDVEEFDFLFGLGVTVKLGRSSVKKKSKPLISNQVHDRDKDGIPDHMDHCLDTAFNVSVDNNGCVMIQKDSDQDGVIDSVDQCPESKQGAKVDDRGCYMALEKELSISLDVKFATASDVVVTSSYTEIARVADFMRTYPETKVVIEGHTDNQGSAAYNRQLSERRASAVAKILNRNYDIAVGRISSIGYGEARPLVSNDTEADRAQNRRVVAIINAVVKGMIQH